LNDASDIKEERLWQRKKTSTKLKIRSLTE
jgi:hypothetical protein